MPPAHQEIDGEEDDVVMTVLGALEDMLYEPVTLGTARRRRVLGARRGRAVSLGTSSARVEGQEHRLGARRQRVPGARRGPVPGGADSDGEAEQWNSCETKEGASLRDEIETFEARALAEADVSDGDEFPLKWTEFHGSFKNLVEGHVSAAPSCAEINLESKRHLSTLFHRRASRDSPQLSSRPLLSRIG